MAETLNDLVAQPPQCSSDTPDVRNCPCNLGTSRFLPVVRSSIAARNIDRINFLNLNAQKYTTTSSLTRNFMLKPVPQLNHLRSITTSQPQRASATGDHVRLWQVERVTSAVLIGLLPACIILENPIVDSTLAILMVMHSHWGLEAVVIDYARPIVVGNIVPKVAHLALNLLSAATLAGLLLLIYNGPGIGKTVKNFWAIGNREATK